MTPDEIRELRAKLGKTQGEFGKALKMSPDGASRRIRRYEAGDPVKPEIGLLMRYVRKFGWIN